MTHPPMAQRPCDAQMHTDEAVFEAVRRMLAKIARVAPQSIDPSTRLIVDLKFDSLQALELLFALEDHFRISIDTETAQTLLTVADVVHLIGPRAA